MFRFVSDCATARLSSIFNCLIIVVLGSDYNSYGVELDCLKTILIIVADFIFESGEYALTRGNRNIMKKVGILLPTLSLLDPKRGCANDLVSMLDLELVFLVYFHSVVLKFLEYKKYVIEFTVQESTVCKFKIKMKLKLGWVVIGVYLRLCCVTFFNLSRRSFIHSLESRNNF
ncbi:hypothetical protein RJT34_32624 [Clitoria ternatea]|uniref:Uncharacterized protein n=1 Tax=Clitoria ternatea TaxID=43366 RepID=A0AAN9F4D2_CLITE